MIRRFSSDDLDAVAQIWLEVNTEAHHFIYENYWIAQFEAVKKMLAQSELYVFDQNGDIIGFAGIIDNYIAGLFVKSTSQSKGIGRKLLNHIKSMKNTLSLNVYQKNERAIKFYKREGFRLLSENIDGTTKEIEFSMLWQR